MELALLVSAALMGLAGGAHCLAMCSAACSGVARACGGARHQQAFAALLGGRLVGYAAAGALAAASVAMLGQWAEAAAWLRPVWSMLHLAALALGLWLLWVGRQPAWMSALGQGLPARLPRVPLAAAPAGFRADAMGSMPAGVVMRGPGRLGAGPLRAGLIGMLWTALPCGLLQSALLVAALASTPVSGALVMAVFAATSSLSLWLGPALWVRLAGRDAAARWQGAAIRGAGLVLAAASLWALVMGWSSPGQSAVVCT